MKPLNTTIGILDWGIGGLGVYQELQRQMKSYSYVYFSDSGFTPYGQTEKNQLLQRLNKILHFFRNKKIYTVVMACNAASTVINQLQKQNPDLRLYGMLEAGQEAIKKSKKKSVLVLGGKRTILSRYFQNNFSGSSIRLQALIAQPLSALIEQGKQNESVFIDEVLRLKIKIQFLPDAVLLACTHYPAATSVFKKLFPKARMIDPARLLVQNLKKQAKRDSRPQFTKFLTTGSVSQSKVSARKAFQIHIKSFQKVQIT